MKAIVNIVGSFFIYLLLSLATFLMLSAIAEHVTFKSDVGFLKYKQDYIHISVWRIAFYVHVFSSIFTLLAAFTQFSNYVLKHHKKIHRLVGRIYVYDILCVNFPAGLIMAIYANGLWPSKIAFIILDCLWLFFTYKGIKAVKHGDVVLHKEHMLRSYALTFSAITLRTWKIFFLIVSILIHYIYT